MTREEEIKQEAIRLAEEYFCDIDAIEKMAEWADAHPISPWISKDNLPENHQSEGCDYSEKVLLRIQKGTYVEYCSGGYDFKNKRWVVQVYGRVEEMPHVTHWMPIPELEKGE